MLYSDELLEEIRIKNDIVEVVSEYVKLEKKGKYYFGLCPFHREKTPSFSVTPSLQIFNCFGCDKGGNVFHFIMNAEGLDFIEAVKFLAERAKISLPEKSDEDEIVKDKRRNEIYSINKQAAIYYHNNLLSHMGKKALEYLFNRKITEKYVKRFGLGYALGNNDSLKKYLTEKGFSIVDIIDSGLVISGDRGMFDRFRNRIMFPIIDLRGNIIGFGGRVTDSSSPKYMNSPNTIVYNKSKSLYGMNFAKNSKDKRIVVVEGYMDVLSLHQNGIINSVASLGTALTEEQGRILKKYSEEILIAYDSDTAGQKATMRGLDLLSNIGCNVRVLVLKNVKDPDEYIRNYGADSFKEILEESLSLAEYKIGLYKKQIDTDNLEGKIEFIKKAAAVLSKVDSKIEIEMYVKKIAGEYDISEESILTEIMKMMRPSSVKKYIPQKTKGNKNYKYGENDDKRQLHDELMLLAVISLDNNIYGKVKREIKTEDFIIETNRKLAQRLFDKLDRGEVITSAELISELDAENAGIMTNILNRECNFDDNRIPVDITVKIKKMSLNRRKKELIEKLKENNSKGDVGLLNELNSIILQLKEYINK